MVKEAREERQRVLKVQRYRCVGEPQNVAAVQDAGRESHRLERKGTSRGRETISKDIVKSHAVKSEDPEQNRVGRNKGKNDSRKTLKVDLIGCQL